MTAYLANLKDQRDIPAALAAWEAAMRPLIEASQRCASLFGELANVPNDARPRIIRAVLNDRWAHSQIAATAASKPIIDADWPPTPSAIEGRTPQKADR